MAEGLDQTRESCGVLISKRFARQIGQSNFQLKDEPLFDFRFDGRLVLERNRDLQQLFIM
jgi:hypothetical protein